MHTIPLFSLQSPAMYQPGPLQNGGGGGSILQQLLVEVICRCVLCCVIYSPPFDLFSLHQITNVILSCVFQTPRALRPDKMVRRRNTLSTPRMTTEWSIRVFSQALKWARENDADPGEINMLREIYQRCIKVRNITSKIKIEERRQN